MYDAEYYAMSSAFLIGIWIHMFLNELTHLFANKFGRPLISGPIVLHGDNSAVVRAMQEQAISTKARHIQLRWHHMMHAIKAKQAEAHGVQGQLNPADGFTKALEGKAFIDFANDVLGIKLINKEAGVVIPPTVNQGE